VSTFIVFNAVTAQIRLANMLVKINSRISYIFPRDLQTAHLVDFLPSATVQCFLVLLLRIHEVFVYRTVRKGFAYSLEILFLDAT
jgi:hypothetical protein